MSRNIVHVAQFLLLIFLFKETLSDEFFLPKHVIPINYNLTIIPSFDSEDLSFEGIAIIQMDCLIGGSKNITLNAKGINISSYSLTDKKGKTISVESLKVMEEENQLVFNLKETLNKTSNYSLYLRYQSNNTEEEKGFRYSESDPVKNESAIKFYYTSMPLANARTVLPCFDEPKFKATFDVTLGRKSNMTTLSNMPHTNINTTKFNSTSLVFDEFKTTPNMSTHVLAFYISTFSNKTAPNTSDVDIKMWAPNYLLGDDNKILQNVGSIYKGLVQYLNFTQPMNKQDLVYTGYFESRGADSWGQINFAPYEMYIGENELPYINEANLITMAQKLSQLWFGNLVTPLWWSDLWLNVGTSTFMSYFVLQKEINKIWEKFSFDVFQVMLSEDSKVDSSPLKIEVGGDVNFPYELLYILSEKGACITRMMMKTFGDEVFKKGIQNYINKFSFKNVVEDNLWTSLQKFVVDKNISVKKIMSGWTNQSGYPLVIVKVNKEGKEINIRQKQFFDKKENNTGKLWRIPFKYQVIDIENQTVVDRELKHIDKNATTKINDSLITKNTLVVANVELLGFFRVNYDKNNWKKIIKQLRRNHSIIHVLNRAQFMDDAFSFVGPFIENYTLGMNISTYLVREKEELPWLTFFKHLQDFYENIILDNRNSEFMKYLKNITTDIFNLFDYTKLESVTLDLTFEFRIEVARWACLSRNNKCNNMAKKAFDKWRNETQQGTELSKIYKEDLFLKTIVCSAIRYANNDTLNFVLEQMKSYFTLQSVISCVEKKEQIHLILSKRKSELLPSLSILTQSHAGRKVIREVLRNITDDKENLLDKNDIYRILSWTLERSINMKEFNKTELVFEDIVTWPQVKQPPLDPKFNLTAIKNHTKDLLKIWSEKKDIEKKVIEVVRITK